MNRWFVFIAFALFFYTAKSQNLEIESNNYASIDSYSGIVKSNAYTVRLHGNGDLNLPTWRVSVRVKQPISNGNQIFPADKISLLPVTTHGVLNGYAIPTVTQIGMPLQTFLEQGQEVFLVPQSQIGLFNNGGGVNSYYNIYIPFNLKVEGGAYLSQFRTWSQFAMILEFKLYDDKNQIRGMQQTYYSLQIATLSGSPQTPTNQLAIKVASNAVNGLLELKTKQDYLQGVIVKYSNGLMVSANTNYQLKVTALQPNFTSPTGNTIPLNTVNLSLIPVSTNQSSVFPVALSANAQKIASGPSTQSVQVYFDIVYATKVNDANLINAKPEQYTTTLQYEILPQ